MSDLTEQVLSLQRRVEVLERPQPSRREFIDRLWINPANPTIEGRCRSNAEHVLLLFDASQSSFSCNLPDALLSKNIIFIGKKTDETVNTVTLIAKPSQYIHGVNVAKSNTLLITTSAPTNMISDGIDTWQVAG